MKINAYQKRTLYITTSILIVFVVISFITNDWKFFLGGYILYLFILRVLLPINKVSQFTMKPAHFVCLWKQITYFICLLTSKPFNFCFA